MKIENVHERLKENYIDEIAERVEFLKSKGYVILNKENTSLYHYTVDKGFISDGAIYEYITKIKNDVVNYFRVPVDDRDIINIMEEILPVVTEDELRGLDRCSNIMEKYTDEGNVKQELKNLKQIHKSRTSKINGTNYNDPTTQVEVLNAEGVVYCTTSNSWFSTSNFYQWNKKEKRFKKLTLEGIQQILFNYFKVTKYEIPYSEVKRNREKYIKDLINTDVPVKWNDYKSFKDDLEKHKKEFKLYNEIIANMV